MTGQWICAKCGEVDASNVSEKELCRCGRKLIWINANSLKIINSLLISYSKKIDIFELELADYKQVIENLRNENKKLRNS